MALNPPLSNQGIPFRLESEYILLERKGIQIEVSLPQKSKLSGKGRIYLTTGRLTFVNDNYRKENFKAFDMPIALLSKYEFKQPVFGSNYLSFDCKSIIRSTPGVA